MTVCATCGGSCVSATVPVTTGWEALGERVRTILFGRAEVAHCVPDRQRDKQRDKRHQRTADAPNTAHEARLYAWPSPAQCFDRRYGRHDADARRSASTDRATTRSRRTSPARRRRPGPRGGVVVIHHLPGYDRATKEIVRRFAELGYDAICPNLYWRERARRGAGRRRGRGRARQGGVPDEQLVGDVGGAAAYLRVAADARTARSACIGYCSGGRQTRARRRATSTSTPRSTATARSSPARRRRAAR